MRIIHKIQHGGERETDVREGGGTCLYAGDMNFQAPHKRYEHHRSVSAQLYDHHQTTLAITNGERTQDITKDWGVGRG